MNITSTSTKHRLHVILRTRIYHLSLLTKKPAAFSNVLGRKFRSMGNERCSAWTRDVERRASGSQLWNSWRWKERPWSLQQVGEKLWTRRFCCFGFKAGIFWKKIGEVMIGVHLSPEMVQLWKNCVLMRVWWFRCSENWSSPLFAPLIAARVPWGVCFRQLGAVQGMLRSPNQICLDLGKFQVNELLRCQEESITYQPKLGWNAAACSLFGDCDEGLVERCWKLACDTVKFDGKDGTRCESSM